MTPRRETNRFAVARMRRSGQSDYAIGAYGTVAALILVLWWGSAVAGSDAKAAAQGLIIEDWLQRINHAAQETSYDGVFVYIHQGEIETVRVVRRKNPTGFSERLFALNNAPREVIRDENEVWCFLPDENIGVHDYRQSNDKNFPRILPQSNGGAEQRISDHYTLKIKDNDRVADRDAQMLYIVPKDGARYGYRLWVDTDTSLLLRADLVDVSQGRMEVLEQHMFVMLDTEATISEQDLKPRTPKSKLKWFGSSGDGKALPIDKSVELPAPENWQATDLPTGFVQTKSVVKPSAMTSDTWQHLTFTDGLAAVSVFVEKLRSKNPTGPQLSRLEGTSKMGAVNAFGVTHDDYHITAVGEVPLDTVRRIAESLTLK